MVFGACVLWCCALCICGMCTMRSMFGASVLWCCALCMCDVCTMCSVFGAPVLWCCVLCLIYLCYRVVFCVVAYVLWRCVLCSCLAWTLVQGRSWCRAFQSNATSSHPNPITINSCATSLLTLGQTCRIFLLDCLRIIVDHLETLLRAYLNYLMTLVTWVTLDYLPLKI